MMSRAEGKRSSWKGGILRGPACFSEPQNGRNLFVFLLIHALPCKGEHLLTLWGPYWVPVSAGSCPVSGAVAQMLVLPSATRCISLRVPTVSLDLGVRSSLSVSSPLSPQFVFPSPTLACLSFEVR